MYLTLATTNTPLTNPAVQNGQVAAAAARHPATTAAEKKLRAADVLGYVWSRRRMDLQVGVINFTAQITPSPLADAVTQPMSDSNQLAKAPNPPTHRKTQPPISHDGPFSRPAEDSFDDVPAFLKARRPTDE